MEIVCLTDITGTLGEWLDVGFEDEVSYEIISSLIQAYELATEKLSK